MDERACFVLEAELSHLSFAELCRRHHISRPTGYKWLKRYRAEGLNELHDRAHRPHSCPHATPPVVVERIVALRERRAWGARKLARVVETEFAHRPSNDTVHRILRRHGLVDTRKPKRKRHVEADVNHQPGTLCKASAAWFSVDRLSDTPHSHRPGKSEHPIV